jgi:MFS family permease
MSKRIFAGWRQVLISLINQAVASGSIIVAFSVVAVALQKEFQPSRAALMLTVTIQYITTHLVHPYIGTLMDRYSIRKITFIGAAAIVAGYVALSYAASMIQVYAIYGTLFAVGAAMMSTLAYAALLSRWFVRQRARAMGITTMGMSFGGFLFPPLLHYLIEDFGWRTAMRLFSVVLAVTILPLIAWLTVDRPSDIGLYPDGDAVPPPAAETKTAATAEKLPTMTFLRDINFWVITIVIGLVLAGAGGVLANLAPLAISKGFTVAQGAFAISCFSMGSFASKILYAWLGDRLRARTGLATGLFIFVLSSFAFVHPVTPAVLLAAAFLQGLAVGTMLPLWSYLTAQVFGQAHVGRVFGYVTAFAAPFLISFPPFLGWMFDRTGAYDDGFYLYIGLALAAALLVPRYRAGTAAQAAAPVAT